MNTVFSALFVTLTITSTAYGMRQLTTNTQLKTTYIKNTRRDGCSFAQYRVNGTQSMFKITIETDARIQIGSFTYSTTCNDNEDLVCEIYDMTIKKDYAIIIPIVIKFLNRERSHANFIVHTAADQQELNAAYHDYGFVPYANGSRQDNVLIYVPTA